MLPTLRNLLTSLPSACDAEMSETLITAHGIRIGDVTLLWGVFALSLLKGKTMLLDVEGHERDALDSLLSNVFTKACERLQKSDFAALATTMPHYSSHLFMMGMLLRLELSDLIG